MARRGEYLLLASVSCYQRVICKSSQSKEVTPNYLVLGSTITAPCASFRTKVRSY